MNKEIISNKQGIYLIIILILGSSSILVMGSQAKKDAWLAVILGIIFTLPMVFLYARLHIIFPGKDLYDILEFCFGKYIGKLICLLYIWFTLHQAALITTNASIFINTVSLLETPIIILIIMISIMGIWVVREGIEVMGKWVQFFLPIMVILLGILVLLAIPKMKIINIMPVLERGIKPIISGAISSMAFPFAETYVFIIVLTNFEDKKSSYKVYIKGLLAGGIIMLAISLTNLLVLGGNTVSMVYYPTYLTAGRVDLFDIIQKIEVVVALVLVLGAFLKISIFLLAACKGITKLFEFRDYRFIVLPMGLILISLSFIHVESTMKVIDAAYKLWPIYSSSFQIVIPIIIWITAEVKKNKLISEISN